MSTHLLPENCHVCGAPEDKHTESDGHTFWSNEDAAREAREYDARHHASTWADGVFAEDRPFPTIQEG